MPGTRPGPQGTVREEDVFPAFVDKVLSFIDIDEVPPLSLVIDAANGMAGVMLPPVLERLPQLEVQPFYFEPDGTFPEPRAQPAASGEPRVHRPEDDRARSGARRRLRRRRRPVLLRGRHGRVRAGRLRDRAPGRVDAREVPGLEGDLRRPRELGRARDDRARRRHPADQPRRARLHQAADARGRRSLRRRGVRPLLLPRLLPGGLRRRSVPADGRADRRVAASACRSFCVPTASATSSPASSTCPSRTWQ